MKRNVVLCLLVFLGLGTTYANSSEEIAVMNTAEVEQMQFGTYISGDPYVAVGVPSAFTVENLAATYYVYWTISSSDFTINSAAPDVVVVETQKSGKSALLTAHVRLMSDDSEISCYQILIHS